MGDSIRAQLAGSKRSLLMQAALAAITAVQHPLDILKGFGSAMQSQWRGGTAMRRSRPKKGRRTGTNPDWYFWKKDIAGPRSRVYRRPHSPPLVHAVYYETSKKTGQLVKRHIHLTQEDVRVPEFVGRARLLEQINGFGQVTSRMRS